LRGIDPRKRHVSSYTVEVSLTYTALVQMKVLSRVCWHAALGEVAGITRQIPAASFVSDHLDDFCMGSPRLLMTFTGG
jgi:hypothetical protein